MEDWKPKIKHYPHFDAPIPRAKIMDIVKNPDIVATNKFYPFLLYNKITPKFGKKLSEVKPRKIRYAARRDSYIFSYYRSLLSKEYEERLKKEFLTDCVLAYRKIPAKEGKEEGKCNIHFAQECFQEILNRKECYAAALDISSYFENLDHDKLELIWSDIMGFKELPSDHKRIFKNITEYAEVEFDKVCEILGIKGKVIVNGVEKFGYKREISKESFFKEKKYKQLCSPKEFREKIVRANIIKKNPDSCGIPQGSPISDILANMYLLNFDKALKSFSEKNAIYYRRYSDDILVIIPRNENLLTETLKFIKEEIAKAGRKLEIKDSKTIIKDFYTVDEGTVCQPYNLKKNDNAHNGSSFEYLGFAFDGEKVRLKDGTMHRFNRKMVYAARHEAANLVARYESKKPNDIMKMLNFSMIYQKFGRVKDFEKLDFSQISDKKKLTFLAYAKKANRIMISNGIKTQIPSQLKKHKKKLKELCYEEILSQWSKRKNKKTEDKKTQ